MPKMSDDRNSKFRRKIAITFGVKKKTIMVWLPVVKKLKIRLFVSTEYTNVTDGQTDRRTDGQTDRHRTTA